MTGHDTIVVSVVNLAFPGQKLASTVYISIILVVLLKNLNTDE